MPRATPHRFARFGYVAIAAASSCRRLHRPMASSRRPLPVPPGPPGPPIRNYTYTLSRPIDLYSSPYYYSPDPYPDTYDEPTTTLPGGTLLHKGFYDLLAMIPTPSPSRLFWGSPPADPVVAGPRYEDLSPSAAKNSPYPSSPPLSPVSGKKGRRISKDMVSKPTGFVYVTLYHSPL